jgi:predicted alpha/beta hydrolase
MSTKPEPEPLRFIAEDGTPLSGVFHTPSEPARSAVLLAGGLGVAQLFYTPFARWLAGQGHLVMTFDLRGMGASRQREHLRSLRGLDADMLTWAQQDFSAAIQTLAMRSNSAQVVVVGHSLGAHHAVMTRAATQERISGLVAVAAGAGYWREWAAPSRRKAPLMLHLAGPLLMPLFGYFPGKRLGMVGDLPAPAMRQWSRWCRHPDFAWGADPDLVGPSLHAARFPIDALSFTDDEAMTEQCTRRLLRATPNAPSRVHVVSPEDVAMHSIGHIGAFRKEAEPRLWPLMRNLINKGHS